MVLVIIKYVPEQCQMSLAWGIGSTLFSSTSAFLQQFYMFEVSSQRGKVSCLRPSMPPGSGFRLRSQAPFHSSAATPRIVSENSRRPERGWAILGCVCWALQRRASFSEGF